MNFNTTIFFLLNKNPSSICLIKTINTNSLIIKKPMKEEKNVMSRPPKDINEKFFGAKKILLSCMQGIGILIICFLVYFVSLKMGYSEKAIRTLTFVSLIVSNIAVIMSNRSWTNNIFKIIATPNKSVKWVVGGAIIFLILILNIPFLINLFQFEKISFIEIVVCAVAGCFSIVWFEIYKLIRKNKAAIV